MAYSIFSSARIKALVEKLTPFFVGRHQQALIDFGDEVADAAYDAGVSYVEPLYDFRTDIMSSTGASLVGMADEGGYYSGTTVEDALQQIGGSVAGMAPLASPTFTGDPKAPTPATADNDTSIATTAFVKAQGYTSNTGTVTSVAVANATGITWSGSPITTSGTLTPSLSANLQSWSGITPSTKADDSAVVHKTGNETVDGDKTFTGTVSLTTTNLLTVGSQSVGGIGMIRIEDATGPRFGWTTTGSRRYTAGNNGSSWTIRDESASADRVTLSSAGVFNFASTPTVAGSAVALDSAVVHLAGTESISGSKTFDVNITASNGVNMGAQIAASVNDCSKHLRLHSSGTGYGLNITSGMMNYTVGAGGGHSWYANGSSTATMSISSSGVLTYGGLEIGYRDIPRTTSSLTRGQMFATAAGVTILTGSAAGSTYSIYNNSAAAITLTQGAGLTLRLAGTATTGNRTLAARGFATLWFNSTTECIVSGNVT